MHGHLNVKFQEQLFFKSLNIDYKADNMSRNVGKNLPIHAALNPRTAKTSRTQNLFQYSEGLTEHLFVTWVALALFARESFQVRNVFSCNPYWHTYLLNSP